MSPGGACGIRGEGGTSPHAGAPVPLCLQHLCRFFAVHFWQGRHPLVRFSKTIAGCLTIAAFTFVCPGNWTPHFFSSQTSARGFLIRNRDFSIVVHENPPLAILVIFKARCMLDCSSCTRPPCLVIVCAMLKTYNKLVAACKNECQLLPLPYMTQ